MSSSFETEMETPEMETLSSLAENIVYRLPGCADIMVRKTIQEVYRDFCRRSCCLCGRRRFRLTSEGEIVVSPMFGGVIDCISEVRYNRILLGRHSYIENGNRIIFRDDLVPDEDTEESQLPRIEVTFVEMPKIGSETVSSSFLQRHGEAICSGVLFRLMSMTGKAWSDAAQASVENVRYENAVNEERMRFYAGHSNGDCGTMTCTEDLV